jgi:uncharacterized protein with PIN domain
MYRAMTGTVFRSDHRHVRARCRLKPGTGSGAVATEHVISTSSTGKGCDTVAVTAHQAAIARTFRRYGHGRHAANLNFGDCFAYALAKDKSAPLLFKGDDFAPTDVMAAPY